MAWPLRPIARFAAILAAAAATSTPTPAGADSPPAPAQPSAESPPPEAPPSEPPLPSVQNTRRGGFTFGLALGLAWGAAQGYPNDFSKIDVPAYRARAAGLGGANLLWIGGALTDWFTFGFGLAGTKFGGDRMYSASSTFLFHLEAFPLFSLGGPWRDLGLSADFGTGSGLINRKSNDEEVAAAGAFSIAGIGLFWEASRIASGHLTFGPYYTWQYQESDSMVRYFSSLGLRGAFYGGP
jgi:hypothetical protein